MNRLLPILRTHDHHRNGRYPWLQLALLVLLFATGNFPADADEPVLSLETGGHTAQVQRVVFTPDGTKLLSAGYDKVVRIWDVRTGKQIGGLRGQIGPRFQGVVNAVAVRADGKDGVLAYTAGFSVSQETRQVGESVQTVKRNSIRQFALPGEQLRRVFSGEGMDTVISLAVSPKDGLVASAGAEGRVLLWNTDTGVSKPLTGHQGPVYGVAFGPEGDTIATGSLDQTVRLWSISSGKEMWKSNVKASVLGLAWGGADTIAVATYQDHRIHLLSSRDGSERGILEQPDAAPCVAWTPDGKTLVTGSGSTQPDFKVRVWNADTRNVARTFDQHTATVLSVAVAPDGDTVASADSAGVIYLWSLRTGTVLFRLAGSGRVPEAVAWANLPGKRIVCWGGAGETGLPSNRFDLDTNNPEPALPAGVQPVPPPTGGGGRLVLHNPTDDPKAHPSVTVERDGKTVATITDAQWEEGERIYAAIYLPDGSIAVGSGYGLRRYVVNDSKARRIATYIGHAGAVRALGVSPDGHFLASGADDQTVRIWNLADKGSRIESLGDGVRALVSLFHGVNGEWVAWNDEYGYYAASPTGDDIVGWHVNRGSDRTADFFTAAQYASRFYRPDVVCRLAETGSVAAALANVSKLAAANPANATALGVLPPLVAPPPVTVKLPEQVVVNPPPRVEVLSVTPADSVDDGYRTRASTVEVKVHVMATGAVPRLQVLTGRDITGKRVRLKPGGDPGMQTVEVTLVRGDNTVAIGAVNDSGAKSALLTLQIHYEPLVPTKTVRKLYVLAIGVGVYKDPEVTPLRFAAHDAEAIRDVYLQQKGRLFDEVTVVTLTNEQVTRERALAEIEKMAKFTKDNGFDDDPEDLALVYVSCHGFPDDGNYYFAPHDLSLADVPKTGISWGDVMPRVRDLEARNVLMLLDTCFSGGANNALLDAYVSERTRGYGIRNQAERKLREMNVVTFTSSSSKTESFESDKLGQSVFTYALVRALEGKENPELERYNALTPSKQVILKMTEPYVINKVSSVLTSLFGKEMAKAQRPSLYSLPTVDLEFPIATLP